MSIILSFIAATLLGMSKAGLKGMGVVVVTLMAIAYGAKASVGILVPLLIIADILAVIYYKRHVKWKYLIRFLPWMISGVLAGVYLGKDLNEATFKKGMAVIIFISVGVMFMWERYDKTKTPHNLWFLGSIGFSAGFTAMIGNLAGAFANIFFIATKLPKNELIGTAAWLFFITNMFKLPFHIFYWETVNWESFKIDLLLIPIVIIGFTLGIKIVRLFGDVNYRKFILVMTAVGALFLIVK